MSVSKRRSEYMQTCIYSHSTIHVFRDNSFYMYHFRDLAKLVSRYIWDVEIVGSSPATPTNIFRRCRISVSSSDFHSEKSGSTPGIATKMLP